MEELTDIGLWLSSESGIILCFNLVILRHDGTSNANEEDPYPSSRTKQGQIACADFEHQIIFTPHTQKPQHTAVNLRHISKTQHCL